MGSRNNASTVQGTNDSSIVSKHAMVEAGYAHDPFLQVFTLKKAPRRAPLINRGYYIRTKAIDSIIREFLLSEGPKQIVSLGAGFDTTYFRMSASSETSLLMGNVYYVEVDFPEVAKRKKDLINCSSLCKVHLTSTVEVTTDAVKFATINYCLVGADLGDLRTLEQLWTSHTQLQRSLPTLVLSECVMTYMDQELSTNLILFCRSFFCSSVFITYEQVEPSDAFGQFMRSHFDKLNSSLKGICEYRDKKRQMERYKSCGYAKVDAFTMKEFFDSLSVSEVERINQLEYFDEYEEWHMKCFHYVLVIARSVSGSFVAVENKINFIKQYDSVDEDETTQVLPATHFTSGVEQFAHSTCIITLPTSEMLLLSHGGFGVLDGKHGRQAVLRAYIMDGKGDVSKQLTVTQALGCRLHHSLIALMDGRVFVFGGRLSPAKPFNQPLFLQVQYADGEQLNVEVQSITPSTDIEPEPRWRHAATFVNIDGEEHVLITGGLTNSEDSCSPTMLTSSYIFNVKLLSWRRLADYPQPVHSHAMCFDGVRYVYAVGGLTNKERAMSDCYRLDVSLCSNSWCKIALPIDNVYSHSLHILGDRMLIVGGVGSKGQQMGVQLLELCTLAKRYVCLPVTIDGSLRMYFNHTSHLLQGKGSEQAILVIAGGGGNCFSFGTHINRIISFHHINCL